MKRIAYIVAAVIALLIPLACRAAPPPCWPTLETVYVTPADPGTGYDYALAWPCGAGPTTTAVVEFATRAEFLRFAPGIIASTGDPQALAAAYNAAPRLRNALAVAQERRIRVNVFGAPPVAAEGIAYKQRLAPGTVNPITYVAIGTLPKTTLCVKTGQFNHAGTFMPVPREAVTLYSKRDVYPVVVYALCS